MQKADNVMRKEPKRQVYLIGSEGIPREALPELRSAKSAERACRTEGYRAGAD